MSKPEPEPRTERSLQDAFRTFLEHRRREIATRPQGAPPPKRRPAQERAAMRARFLRTALSYVGVPYTTVGRPPSEIPAAPPYSLDCCGLVRQVLRDMADELGFRAPGYNQAWMYDALPVEYDTAEQMRPGDLILYEGVYTRPGKPQQIHGITHVEIYHPEPGVPGSMRCVGSRFRSGAVAVHESFVFDAAGWTLKRHIFKSIDTWLDGTCTSFCPEHRWRTRADGAPGIGPDGPAPRSIFALPGGILTEDECIDAEPEGDWGQDQ